jgi:hypothetical protein
VRYELGFSIPEDGILGHRCENLKSYKDAATFSGRFLIGSPARTPTYGLNHLHDIVWPRLSYSVVDQLVTHPRPSTSLEQ